MARDISVILLTLAFLASCRSVAPTATKGIASSPQHAEKPPEPKYLPACNGEQVFVPWDVPEAVFFATGSSLLDSEEKRILREWPKRYQNKHVLLRSAVDDEDREVMEDDPEGYPDSDEKLCLRRAAMVCAYLSDMAGYDIQHASVCCDLHGQDEDFKYEGSFRRVYLQDNYSESTSDMSCSSLFQQDNT
jgi:hypothetical protein